MSRLVDTAELFRDNAVISKEEEHQNISNFVRPSRKVRD